jgi:hypothetical protein
MPAWLKELIVNHCNQQRDRRPVQIHEGVDESPQELEAWSPHEIAEIRALLKRIPADDYWVWLKVAAALYNAFGEDGREIFYTWSKTSSKHTDWKCKRKWNDAKEMHSITIGTIYWLADEYYGGDDAL